MSSYETSATVEEQGRVLVAGVPFATGTQVEVTINPIQNGVVLPATQVASRSERLLTALDKGRNVEPPRASLTPTSCCKRHPTRFKINRSGSSPAGC
jgi:hypothetical protein